MNVQPEALPDFDDIARDIQLIPEADRVKLAILLIRDVNESTCIVPLRRLEAEAGDAAFRLVKARFQKECG